MVSVTLPSEVLISTVVVPFSPAVMALTVPAAGAVNRLLLVFSPVGVT